MEFLMSVIQSQLIILYISKGLSVVSEMKSLCYLIHNTSIKSVEYQKLTLINESIHRLITCKQKIHLQKVMKKKGNTVTALIHVTALDNKSRNIRNKSRCKGLRSPPG